MRLIAYSIIIIYRYFTIVATNSVHIWVSNSPKQLCNWEIDIARWKLSIPTSEIIDVKCKIILVYIIRVCRIVYRGRMLKEFFFFHMLQTRYQNNLFFGRFQAFMQFQCLKYFNAPKIFKSKNLSKLNMKVNINNAKSD